MSGAVAGYRVNDRRGGAKAFGYGIYQTPRNTNQQEYYRPRHYLDLKEAVPQYDWFEMLQYSRQLFGQRGNLAAAVSQKNTYAVADSWSAQYFGTNKAWGEEVEEWLSNVWYPNCDIRGGIFDFQTNLWLTGIAMDVDGDDTMAFAIREDDQFPLLKFYMAHEVASGGADKVDGGAWDGYEINIGVICGPNKEFLGVRIVNEEDGPADLPAKQCQLLFEPEWRNTYRGIPRIGKSILDWFDVEDIDAFLKRGVKLDASIGLLHWTEEGAAPTAADIIAGRGTDGANANVDPADVKFEKRLGGEIMYMRAGKGEKIEGFRGDRPHPNSEAFVERIERRGMASVGWFYEMLDPSSLKGAANRLIQDQVRASIGSRQKTLRKRAKRAVQFAVMQAQLAGFISKNPDPDDQFKWGFGMPAKPTVDQGYEDEADREGLKLGVTPMSDVCQKKGAWWEDVREQFKRENKNLIDAAVELVTYSQGKLSFREALELMQQRSPNPVQGMNQQQKPNAPASNEGK